MRFIHAGTLLTVCLLAASGCKRTSEADEAQLSAQRSQYLLADEPAGAETVLDIRERLSGQSAGDVVIVGLIGGIEDPWAVDEAAFVIADPFIMAEGHHECEGCAFCTQNKNTSEALALVQFLGSNGQPLPIDSRKLFQLVEKQTVVVRGKATVSPAGLMIVSADGLYIRR